MREQLQCGAAIRDITPPLEILHGLRGLMGTRYGGIHDELKVRAIAFSNGEDRALIVQLDLDKDQQPTVQLPIMSSRWNVPEENILYFGVHTHSAPMFSGRHELRETTEEVLSCTHQYEKLVFDAMYEAIDEAFANLKPARIGCGKATSYTNVRRVQDFWIYGADGKPESVISTQGMDPGADASHELFVMRVNDLADKPIAFLVNYPMHCVIMFLNKLAEDGNDLISGDVAGNVSRLLEVKFPGAVAAWSSGAAGDMNPLINSFGAYVNPLTNEIEHFNLKGMADKVLDYVAATQYADAMRAINDIPYFSGNSQIRGAVDWSRTPKYKTVPDPEGGRPVVTDEIDSATFDVRMQLLRLGDVALVGVGGELFNSFAEELKALSPLRNTAVINHNLSLISNVGYIVNDEAIARNYSLMPGAKNTNVPGHLSNSLRGVFCGILSD